MTGVLLDVLSRSVEETRAAGRELARLLRPGTLVLLSGPLGAGKTELVRGIADGLGAGADEVASPTFALVHEYGRGGEPAALVHADLYRLLGGPSKAAGIEDLGLAEAREQGAVVVVEWPEALPEAGDGVAVEISLENDGARRIVARRATRG